MGGRVEHRGVGRQGGLPPRGLRELLGRQRRDGRAVPGGARGRGAVEHVDVAQVEVLVLQDGAQLLEDVASRRIGCGGASGGRGRGREAGETVDSVVALEVALLSDRRKIARGNGGYKMGLITYENGGHFEVNGVGDLTKISSRWSRRGKDLHTGRGQKSKWNWNGGGRAHAKAARNLGRLGGGQASRRASTPVQVARSQQKERNAWAPWGVKVKLISLLERRNI